MTIRKIWSAPLTVLSLVACGGEPMDPPPDAGAGGDTTTSSTTATASMSMSTTSSGTGSGGEGGAACSFGLAECNGNPDDGCETDITNDPRNCGACGIKCELGSECKAGKCLACSLANECETAGYADDGGWVAWPVVGASDLHVIGVELQAEAGGTVYVLSDKGNAPGVALTWKWLLPSQDPNWMRADVSFDVAPGETVWIAVDSTVRLCESGTTKTWRTDDPMNGSWSPATPTRTIPVRLNGYCN